MAINKVVDLYGDAVKDQSIIAIISKVSFNKISCG